MAVRQLLVSGAHQGRSERGAGALAEDKDGANVGRNSAYFGAHLVAVHDSLRCQRRAGRLIIRLKSAGRHGRT